MGKKKQASKTETQAAEKPPIELSDDLLNEVQGGKTWATSHLPLVTGNLPIVEENFDTVIHAHAPVEIVDFTEITKKS